MAMADSELTADDFMNRIDNNVCKTWYDDSYRNGFAAQRLYPNEELLRFLGRHYFSLPLGERKAVRILEVGCGTGANLWMVAREGFDAHGVELSQVAVDLCDQMLARWQTAARVRVADMTTFPYADRSFNVVLDVFSSYCLDERGSKYFLDETKRVLRPGGRFFSYTPSKASDAFKDPGPSKAIDPSTLDGIHRKDAPFCGNIYPFRFIAPEEYAAVLNDEGCVAYNETIGRTYRSGVEYFEFVVIVGEMPDLGQASQ
jgi:SAM-dependent methyltransferase